MSGEGRARRLLLDAAPLLVAWMWGLNIPVMKGVLGGLHPFAFNAARLTLSVLVLGAATALERAPRAERVPWLRVVLIGLALGLLYQVLFLLGIARTSAGHTALIIASSPLWTAIFAWLLRVERAARDTWLGIGLAFAGTALVVANGGASAGASVAGNLIVLAAAMTWALGSVLSRPLFEHLSPTRFAFLSSLVSLPGHWLLARPHVGELAALGPRAWTAIAYSGAFSTGIAYALWNVAVRQSGPARAAIFTNLVPVIALLAAWVGLGEVPAGLQLAGGALVLLGVRVSRGRRRYSSPPSSSDPETSAAEPSAAEPSSAVEASGACSKQ